MTATQQQVVREMDMLPPDYGDYILEMARGLRMRLSGEGIKKTATKPDVKLSERFRGSLRVSHERYLEMQRELTEGRDAWGKRTIC